MRFLHCSDLHLGRKPVGSILSAYSKRRYEDHFNAFDFIVNKAMEEEVDAFLVAGDLFDRRELSPDVLERTEGILKKLKNAKIPAVVIEGNHDRILGTNENSWLEYLSREELIHLLKPFSENGIISYPPWNGRNGSWIEIKGVRFYGIGYQGYQFPEYLRALNSELDDSKENVVLIHTSVGDPNMVLGCVKKEEIEKISQKCDYVAGGHIHTKRIFNDVKLFVPGAPEYWDLGENGEKGFFIFDTLQKKASFYESQKRTKITASIKLTKGTALEFSNEFQKALKENPLEEGCLYVLNVKVPFGTFLDVDTAAVERELEKGGALKAKVSINFTNIRENDDMETFSETDALEEEIIRLNPFFASHSLDMAHALKKLKSAHDSSNSQEAFEILDELFLKIRGEKDEDTQR